MSLVTPLSQRPIILPRCFLSENSNKEAAAEQPKPLPEFRGVHGYALLGDPGSGKSTTFEHEAHASGGLFITAGDFLVAGPMHWPDPDLPIFIDALDETRAGSTDGRIPLIGIVAKLKQLGCRYVRISCRSADWLGNPDIARLQSVLPIGAKFEVLRLLPLTLGEVAQLLSNFGIENSEVFIQLAREHRLEALLFNPQTLRMLVNAVAGDNEWPQSRCEIYDLACTRLCEEHNEEHDAATRFMAPNHAQLRQAAGYISVLFLISDLRGFTLSNAAPARAVAIKIFKNSEHLPLREVLATRLFKEIGNGVFAPVHRTMAEFLAAEFLSEHIGQKLTVRRVLALMCGADGGVVSGLRGLNAWIATLSPQARQRCIELDPLGVLTYGDVSAFSPSDKNCLLNAIYAVADDSSRFRWHEWELSPLAALVSLEMLPAVKDRLGSTDRSTAAQITMTGLAEGIEQNGADLSIAPILEFLVRDTSCNGLLRRTALAALVKVAGPCYGAVMQLLQDIGSGTLEDNNDELLGTLLELCYPVAIPASDVVRYLHAPKDERLIGHYRMFWRRKLGRMTNGGDFAVLMDAFAMVTPTLRQVFGARHSKCPISQLLVRAVNDFGSSVDDDRLLTWLDAGCDEYGESILETEDVEKLHAWFKAHPERYLGVLASALSRWTHAWEAISRLHTAPPPENICLWWLAKVEAEKDDKRAERYLIEATTSLPKEWSPRLDIMLTECSRVARERRLENQLEHLLSCNLEHWKWKLKQADMAREERQAAATRRQEYLCMLPDIERPDAPIELLDTFTLACQGEFHDIRGETAMERLTALAGGEECVVLAARKALENSVFRKDLPTSEETLAAHAVGRRMTLNAPALLGTQMQFERDPLFLDSLAANKLKALLVAHFVELGETGCNWVRYAAQRWPEEFADALVEYINHSLLHMRRAPYGTYAMRAGGDYEVPARLCLIRLLKAYPPRASKEQNYTLSDLLHGALEILAPGEIIDVVQEKLAAPKMDGGQRAMWLAAGLIVKPATYTPTFEAYLRRSFTRIDNVGAFLQKHRKNQPITSSLPTRVLGSLAEHLAPGCSPDRSTAAGRVTSSMRRADFVNQCLNELAARPEQEAAAELRRLENAAKLSAWSWHVRHARGLQQAILRDANFEYPSTQAVCAALEAGPPQTASEIAAITNDILEELAIQVRGSEFNLRRQFWNLDRFGKPTKPRHEEDCRDVLGNMLKSRLQNFGITCIPENHHVKGKRSDLWCMVISAGVPIEAKREMHPALWTATRSQLIARYASDPRAQGYGIYLVFWFGGSGMPLPPSGVRPQTPEELRSKLLDELIPHERQMISIHVIDCSL